MSAVHGFPWLHTPAWQPLVHALLHTLWQGALLAGGLFLVLRWVPARRANLRYGLSMAALALVLLLGLSSWALLDTPRPSTARATHERSLPAAAVTSVPGPLPAPVPASTLLPIGERTTARTTGVSLSTINVDDGRTEPWVHRVAVFWLLGVGVSLLRAAKGAFGAERLRRRCQDLANPRILALAEELCGRLGLSRRVRLLVSEEIGVPSVLGVLWPAVLLPASMLTGVSPEQLRAILAHELAHIRRWDYLVNLAQVLVEALLFFNPFVWWISRQMRLEREACCDQLAAGECQSAASYVEALVAVIEHTRHAAPAASVLAASGLGGSALERARRLLVPGYQPALRLRWFSLLAVLILSASMLGGLWLGTRAIAQTIQAPEAKAKPIKSAAPLSTPSPESFVATVSTADGAPADDDSTTAYFYESPGAHKESAGAVRINQPGLIVNHQKGRFTIRPKADSRTFSCAVTMQGYAATFAGPFTPPFKELENMHFTLQKGLTVSIETVDETGKPIVGALLHGYYPGPPWVDFGEVKTDTAGDAVLEHAGDAPLNVRVLADGFQGDELKNVQLDPAKPYRWTLKKTDALPGLVTAATTGRPVAGATIKLAGVRGAMDETNGDPEHAPLLATSDAQGRFALTSLRPDCRYYLFVEAPGYSGVFVRELEPSRKELVVSLGPERTVRGKLVHIPDSAFFLDGVPLFYRQDFTFNDNSAFSSQRVLWLHPKNGESDFSVGPFFVTQHGSRPEEMSGADGPVEIYLEGRRKVRFGINDLLKAGYTYDLAKEPGTSPVPAASPEPSRDPANSEPHQSDAAGSTPVSSEVLAAARKGDAKQALSLLEASVKPKRFGTEDEARVLDELVRVRELRAFTTLYDALWHYITFNWKLSDELLAGLVKDGRTDFLDVLVVHRFDLDRLTKAAASADPATTAWITRRVTEANKQEADIEALQKAAADNDLPALERLVDAGADVNGVGKDDNTPLLRAVFKNRLEAAQWLLDHGAQVDKPRLPGWNYTPLCLVNSVPMAELLKKYGADVHAKLYERDTSILTYAVNWAKADVVAWFLKQGLDANMTGDNQQNLLFGLKDGATAEVLLTAGADPNRVDKFGDTPLSTAHTAAVARALIQHGANLKPKLKDGDTLLERAVYKIRRTDDTPEEDAAYIEELIKQGAEFDPKGNGVKAMIATAFYDRVGEVRVFLDHGVSPDASYEQGSDGYRSALSNAADHGPKCLKLLLERGANPNAPVPAGQMTPLDTALSQGAFGNVDLLRQAGAKGLSDLAYYTAKGDVARVGELLDNHADPNEAGSSGWTPLIYAVKRAQVEAARRLLDHGASVDQFDGAGVSPYLEFAQYKWMIEWDAGQAQLQWHLPAPEAKARLAAFQELFTQHPPNFAYRNSEGRTALHQAAWAGNSKILGWMLEGHPPRFDPNLPDKDGRTALLLVALSPIAKDTREIFTSDMGTPQQKTQNQQAHFADELLAAGARLDVIVPGGKTVGELAIAAARDANNAQLAAVLTEALQARLSSGATSPALTPGGSASGGAPGKDAAPAAGQPQDLANLEPDQRDTIWTAAFAAIKAGNIQTVDGFLQRGLDVNVDLENSSSLLFLAVDYNQLAIVKLLLAHGANILQKTSWGDVPLKRACWRGYRDIADALIQAGAPGNELWYATGMGDVSALEARNQRQPITPKEARDHLFFAVASGHPNTFGFLWKKLAPISDADKDKLLGDLYENVGKWGHANMLSVLEALGATATKDGSRALAQAAVWNYPETVEALLERGVPPDPPSKSGRLRNAAGEGHLEIVRLLLDHGADINVQDDHGYTPLSWAAYCGKEDICLLLLERGADGRIKDRDGRNAAWHAAAGPHCPEALARMLTAGVPVTETDKDGATILDHMMHFSTPGAWHGAFFMKVYSPADIVRFNESEQHVIELLLDAGVNPNGGKLGLLAEAMYSNHYEAARVLLAHGADPALKDQNGDDALFALVNYVPDGPLPLDLFKTLLQRDGRPNPEETAPGDTPPMKTALLDDLFAFASRNPLRTASFGEAVKIMLDGGATFASVADANAQALLQGAARGHLAAIEQSVQRGAPVDVASDQGWDALTVATALGYDDCAGWLLDHGADVNGHHPKAVNSPLIFAVQRGRADLVERLLGKGAKIADGYDALFWAVDQKNVRVFDALLRAGADLKAQPHDTMRVGDKTFTPHGSLTLFLCIEKGLTDMARTLLAKGADADPPNLDENRNLAYWAVSYDRSEILQSLLDHGANPLVKDDKGDSALDFARKYRPKLVPMLEEAGKRKSVPAL